MITANEDEGSLHSSYTAGSAQQRPPPHPSHTPGGSVSSEQADQFSNSIYAPRSTIYAPPTHRVPRDRYASDSRVHYHAPFTSQNSVDRRHRHRSNDHHRVCIIIVKHL